MKINNLFSQYIIVSIFTLLFTFGFTTNEAFALTLSPVRMELSAEAGTTVTKEITLLNDTLSEATYYVTYANFEAQGETGSPSFVEPKEGLGTWMSTEKIITILAGESKTVSLLIDIPKDAYAGGHFAVVFFGSNPLNGGQVSVGAKTGSLILLTVEGDVLEAGGLSSFETYGLSNDGKKVKKSFFNTLPVSFDYRWKNDGNDRIKPTGDISIRSLFFIPIAKIEANPGSGNVLPKSTRLFSVDWVKNSQEPSDDIKENSFINSYLSQVVYQWKNFAVGPYLAHLDLVSGVNNTNSTKNVLFFVFPWQLLIVLFIVFFILFFFGKKFMKNYNKRIIEQARLGMNTPSDLNNG